MKLYAGTGLMARPRASEATFVMHSRCCNLSSTAVSKAAVCRSGKAPTTNILPHEILWPTMWVGSSLGTSASRSQRQVNPPFHLQAGSLVDPTYADPYSSSLRGRWYRIRFMRASCVMSSSGLRTSMHVGYIMTARAATPSASSAAVAQRMRWRSSGDGGGAHRGKQNGGAAVPPPPPLLRLGLLLPRLAVVAHGR